MPLIEIARAKTKPEALEALERWKSKHPKVVKLLEPADVLVDGQLFTSYLFPTTIQKPVLYPLLTESGKATMLGTPVDLRRITLPTFVTGAMTDHLTPWTGCYRTTQLLSGPSTFVLSSSGHIQSLVNPPGNPKMFYYTGGEPGHTMTSCESVEVYDPAETGSAFLQLCN